MCLPRLAFGRSQGGVDGTLVARHFGRLQALRLALLVLLADPEDRHVDRARALGGMLVQLLHGLLEDHAGVILGVFVVEERELHGEPGSALGPRPIEVLHLALVQHLHGVGELLVHVGGLSTILTLLRIPLHHLDHEAVLGIQKIAKRRHVVGLDVPDECADSAYDGGDETILLGARGEPDVGDVLDVDAGSCGKSLLHGGEVDGVFVPANE